MEKPQRHHKSHIGRNGFPRSYYSKGSKSKRAELETLNEQIAQQQTENQEMQRILSGDADQITEWGARDSYNYAAPNERIFVDVTGN